MAPQMRAFSEAADSCHHGVRHYSELPSRREMISAPDGDAVASLRNRHSGLGLQGPDGRWPGGHPDELKAYLDSSSVGKSAL
jgi:hypothetical protein